MNHHSATDFIKDGLDQFIKIFPMTRVRYEFDVAANVHCVEVVPHSVYYSEEAYINWENEFTDRFIEHFPCENIYFFSNDAIVGIHTVQFERIGSAYADSISTKDCKTTIDLERISISNSSNALNMDEISSSKGVLNGSVAYQVNESRSNIDQANSLTTMEYQHLSIISFTDPMAA